MAQIRRKVLHIVQYRFIATLYHRLIAEGHQFENMPWNWLLFPIVDVNKWHKNIWHFYKPHLNKIKSLNRVLKGVSEFFPLIADLRYNEFINFVSTILFLILWLDNWWNSKKCRSKNIRLSTTFFPKYRFIKDNRCKSQNTIHLLSKEYFIKYERMLI